MFNLILFISYPFLSNCEVLKSLLTEKSRKHLIFSNKKGLTIWSRQQNKLQRDYICFLLHLNINKFNRPDVLNVKNRKQNKFMRK